MFDFKTKACPYNGDLMEWLTCISDDDSEPTFIDNAGAYFLSLIFYIAIFLIAIRLGIVHIIFRCLQRLLMCVYNFCCPAQWAINRPMSQSEMQERRNILLQRVGQGSDSLTLPETIPDLFDETSDASRLNAGDLSSSYFDDTTELSYDDISQPNIVDKSKKNNIGKTDNTDAVIRPRFGNRIKSMYPPLSTRPDAGEPSGTDDADDSSF